jgi:hypothetical protein
MMVHPSARPGLAALAAVLTLAAPSGNAAIAPRGARAAAPAPILEVPFAFRTGQPIVPVRVNDGAPVPFVIDTGASIHLIDRAIADQASVTGGRVQPLTGGGQAPVETRIVEGLTLSLAGRRWPAQRAALAPLGYPNRKHFAGLLGASILTQYAVEFAFASHVMRLHDPATYRLPAGATALPFELDEDLPIVHVTIDAGTGPIVARLMVDTAASTSIDLNRPFVEAHRLVEALPEAEASDRPAALGGTAPFLYAIGRRATLGNLTFDRPRLGLSRATTGSSARRERDGIIGTELLRQFDMTVDYRRRTLVLARPAGK